MIAEIASEFATAELGDARLTKRAMLILGRWAERPAASFPKMMEDSDAELQGLYGFHENVGVSHEPLVQAHVRETVERIDATGACVVLTIGDTTEFAFAYNGAEREGLGWLSRNQQGFRAHFVLALSADSTRRPLGVLSLSIHQRERPQVGAPPRTRDGKQLAKDPTRESLRWGVTANEVAELLRGHAVPIFVTDREADTYEYIDGRISRGQRFVLRARELDRPVLTAHDGFTDRTKLRVIASRAVQVAERDVQLSRRTKSTLPAANKKHPPRDAREAKLSIASERVRIPRPKHLGPPLSDAIDVNLVHVREIDAPSEVQPVEWLLLTTESIDTPEDVLTVVDHYRARWTIEEFNKAIKTGCQYEKRQLESAHALFVALAFCIPIAWQMLALRHQARLQPEASATTVLTQRRLDVLRIISKRMPLSEKPTAKEVWYAIASLGGHRARNGPPGWQSLRDGLERLLLVEAAFDARDGVGGGRGEI